MCIHNSVVDVLYSFTLSFILKTIFLTAAKEGAGAVDEEDFIKAFDDVPVVQVGVVCAASEPAQCCHGGLSGLEPFPLFKRTEFILRSSQLPVTPAFGCNHTLFQHLQTCHTHVTHTQAHRRKNRLKKYLFL